MARKVEVPGAGAVKVINPWFAFVLALITFGLYYVIWYGWRNSELNDYGESLPGEKNPIRVGPVGAMLAITVGWLLFVPPFVSQWRFYKRIGRAQGLAGVEDRINHVAGFLLFLVAVVFLPFEIAYAQQHLNRLWERIEAQQERQRIEQGAQP